MTEDGDKLKTFVASSYGHCWPPDHGMMKRTEEEDALNGCVNSTMWYCRKGGWRPLQTCEDSRVVGLACVCCQRIKSLLRELVVFI